MANTIDITLDKKNFINVNPKGTFREYQPLGFGPEMSKFSTSYKDVDNMFEYFRANNIYHIALFFHGGLVGEGRGYNAAERFYKFYNGINNVHPVSFVWETGPVSSLIEHVKDAFRNPDFLTIFYRVLKIIMKRLGVDDLKDVKSAEDLNTKIDGAFQEKNEKAIIATAAVEFGDSSLEEIQDDLSSSLSEDERLSLYTEEYSMMQSDKAGISLNVVVAAIKVAARCIYRLANKRNHGVRGTIMEEVYRELKFTGISLGNTAIGLWNQMKKQADLMWRPNDKLKEDDRHCGRYFLDELVKYVKEVKELGSNVSIEIVAHSAGSIVICELFELLKLEKTKYADIRFNNVIFLAPACKCSLFHATVMNMPDRYNRFRMFTMKQEREEKDRVLPIIRYDTRGVLYPMSLLYLVSGLCEDGDKYSDADIKGDTLLLGLEQHIKKQAPYHKYEVLNEIHEFLNEGGPNNNRLVLTRTSSDAPLGYRGQSIDHGDFDNDGEHQLANSIRESITHLFNS